MIEWHRKRAPEDVPTPVAVALSDFCRRARATASPAVVRDALSCLDESLDARVRALADTEPQAWPLGPFAVVDLVSTGSGQSEAAQREKEGHYAAVRQGLRALPPVEAVGPPVGPPDAAASLVSPVAPPRAPTQPKRASKAAQVQDRIRPVRRAAGEVASTEAPQVSTVYGTSFLPRHNLPAPRGRFTRIDPARSSFEVLLRPESAELVATLVTQAPHRFALWRTLDQGYSGRRGQALCLDEVLSVLDRHQQTRAIVSRERESVLGALTDARGAAGRASQVLGLREHELSRLISGLKLTRDVAELRERFGRDALDAKNLSWRLDLLGRQRYLADLGIEAKFDLALARDLRPLVEAEPPALSRLELADRIARTTGLGSSALERALEHLGLP
jgi:hypothetical protein